MICDTCDREFQDSAVKVWRGKRVCPGCFRVLGESDTPDENRHVQVVKTESMRTTVCPDCNAEIHADTRKCPYCRAPVKRIDRAIASAAKAATTSAPKLVHAYVLSAFWIVGIMLVVGGVAGLFVSGFSGGIVFFMLVGIAILALLTYDACEEYKRSQKPQPNQAESHHREG